MTVRRAMALVLAAAPAAAQERAATVVESASTPATQLATPSTAPQPIWIAGVSGGLLERDNGPDSPYGIVSLTRYQGHGYVRGAFTVYRSTLQQIDATLPSTFYIGSIGAGGNWNGWVVDTVLSYGRQRFGLVETPAGTRPSEAGDSAPYVALGARGGRAFQPVPRLYLTPTLGLLYTDTDSLRHRINFSTGQPEDFQLQERALTANLALRLDRTFGRNEQNYLGVALTHYQTTNGQTSWRTGSDGTPEPWPTPDSWQDVALSGSWQLGSRFWLDGQVQRTFGAVAGDGTALWLGLRARL